VKWFSSLSLFENFSTSKKVITLSFGPSTYSCTCECWSVVPSALAGGLLNINAFNQPGVEEGKIATYALMGREGYEQKFKEIEKLFKKKKTFII